MANGKKFTYAELSKETGISIATISRVMNRSHLVTSETRRKVLSVLSDCGVDISELEFEEEDEKLIVFNVPTLKNMFYSPIISSARLAASRRGYNLLVNEDPVSSESLHAFLRLLRSTKASGLILANSITQERLESLSREIVTVTCCEAVPDSNVPYVTIDDEGASYNAVRYLISLGRRGIAFINGPRSFKYAREREKGYLEALHESGFEAEHRYMAEVGEDMDFETARAIATHMLNYPDRPDAFFCVSDIIACAVEKAALQLSLRIPEDIAIVGFDDIMASHMANPSITTVRQPTVQMGALSTEMVIKLIEKDENSIKSVILGTELVIRESTTV